MAQWNGIGRQSIEHFLDEIVCDASPAQRVYLHYAVARFLRRRGPFFLPDEALRHQVQDIADWLGGAIRLGEAWLKRFDKRDRLERPSRLLGFKALDEMHAVALRETRAMEARAMRLDGQDEGRDIETVWRWMDGYRMVRLRSRLALRSEAVVMQHCAASDATFNTLTQEGVAHYSLRDAQNRAHVTMQVVKGCLRQARGKQNEPPADAYIGYAMDFITRKGFTLSGEAQHTGIVEWRGAFYPLRRMPAGIDLPQALDLSELRSVIVLPEGLRCGPDDRLIVGPRSRIDFSRSAVRLIETQYIDELLLHRAGAPASEVRDREGRLLEHSWHSYGTPHRIGGPQTERFDAATGALVLQEWRDHGVLHRMEGPARIAWRRGQIVAQEYYLHGERKLTPSPSCIGGAVRGPLRSPSPG